MTVKTRVFPHLHFLDSVLLAKKVSHVCLFWFPLSEFSQRENFEHFSQPLISLIMTIITILKVVSLVKIMIMEVVTVS